MSFIEYLEKLFKKEETKPYMIIWIYYLSGRTSRIEINDVIRGMKRYKEILEAIQNNQSITIDGDVGTNEDYTDNLCYVIRPKKIYEVHARVIRK